YLSFCDDAAAFCHNALGDRDAAQVALPELLAHLFAWLGTPLEVDELTTHVARLQQVEDLEPLSLQALSRACEVEHPEPVTQEDMAAQVVAALSTEQRRVQLWQQIRSLLPRQRAALLLGMPREQLLLVAGTATDAAEALEISLEEWISIWRALPLAD